MTTAIVLMFIILMVLGYSFDKLTDKVKAINDKLDDIDNKLDSIENSLNEIYINTKQPENDINLNY